jgi:anti-sigma regulatory factor (Ser/Thr protein kinase)
MTAARWTLPATLEAPAVARRLTRSYAAEQGADGDTLSGMALAVTEAVANVVMHAYRDRDEAGEVELELARPNSFLCCYIRDDGDGFAPRIDSPGLGLGLPLISQSADALEIRRLERGGTEIVLRFSLAAD